MDKNAIKKYAIWARRELIERVSQRAMVFGISAEEAGNPDADTINGHLLSRVEKRQRQALIQNINEKGYEQVMEEVAYTWFNRFAALRFMEVNGYLPSHIRVFTNDAGEFKPQILAEAIHLELDGLDMNIVYELENSNKREELFKYLLIVQCNALNSILPGMFQRIEDYTELLFPDYLLREGSVIEQMVTTIPEADWTDQVQIIGWLYQYYNTEPKDKVFSDLKKKIKITKERIPAATQLFTPDWIVHYMVENSLGRLWLEGHPNNTLKSGWKYYLAEAEQETVVKEQLADARIVYSSLRPEEIKVIDPCCGSGHILCVFFDVLTRIYEDYGFSTREAAVKIVENNLWGVDIDGRAAQLSYFAVMMKARQTDRRFFEKKVQPHVYAIEESNGITPMTMNGMGQDLSPNEYDKAVKQVKRLVEEMNDAKEYGSLIHITPSDWNLLRRFAKLKEEDNQLYFGIQTIIETSARLQRLIDIGEVLSQKYDVLVTNPPYMGGNGMSNKLSKYVKCNYPDSKSDLFAVFIERCRQMTKPHGFQAMITQQAWMFLGSFEKLRNNLQQVDVINMAHLGAHAFEEIGGEIVQTTSFVLRNSKVRNYKGTYVRLVEPVSQRGKEEMFLSGSNRFVAIQNGFSKIPGAPFAYWISDSLMACYEHPLISSIAFSDGQILTGNNDKYLRLWWEVNRNDILDRTWALHAKGGEFRRWYGNIDTVVKFDSAAIAHYKKDKISRFPKDEILFRKGITWTLVSMNPSFGVRYLDDSLTFNKAAATILFNDDSLLDYVLGFLNTKVAQSLLRVINPTMNNNIKDVLNMPFIMLKNCKAEIDSLVQNCVALAKDDWDSFENSWDFKEHPFITAARETGDEMDTIKKAYEKWEITAEKRFLNLQKTEEKLNQLFINIYGLDDELSSKVEESDVTVYRADLNRDMRSFISYAVGCMFGRYSLGKPGYIYAGGDWKISEYTEFLPDQDAIIPICDDEYFEDDIVTRFVAFVEKVFGTNSLEENLQFIADALGGKGTSRDVIRNYFTNNFYKDHLKMYQKRPIYWLFDSGKKNGFKCLVYIHRYRIDTVARIRTDYLHEQQSRYRTAIIDLEQRINGVSSSDRVRLKKQVEIKRLQERELQEYEEKVHHIADQMIEIDLNDGVKVNYAKFQSVLAKY